MQANTTKPLRTWTIEGTTEDGTPDTTRVTIERNPDWTREDADDEPRYLVTRLDGVGDEWASDTADTKGDAADVAEAFAEQARDDYATVEADRREERGQALNDIALDWSAEGPDGDDQEAVDLLAALRAAGA
jgi:hypothetical protein